MKRFILLGVILFGSGCVATPDLFKPRGATFSPVGYKVWKKEGGAGSTFAPVTPPDTWRAASIAHGKAYKLFNYKSDEYITGKSDSWIILDEVRPVTGDCEDFAILARQILKEGGITDTRFVVAKVGKTFHLVLEYQGWILDNRKKEVVTKSDLNYKWFSIQDYNGKWRRL